MTKPTESSEPVAVEAPPPAAAPAAEPRRSTNPNRDMMAALALGPVMAAHHDALNTVHLPHIAKRCYQLADALIAASEL